MVDNKALKEAVAQFILQLGYIPLDLQIRRVKEDWKVNSAIFHLEAITLKDCTEVTRALRDYLVGWLGNEDFSLDISSPGAERVLKSPLEYALFRGKKVKVVLKSGAEGVYLLVNFDETEGIANFFSEENREAVRISFQDIAKCQLVL